MSHILLPSVSTSTSVLPTIAVLSEKCYSLNNGTCIGKSAHVQQQQFTARTVHHGPKDSMNVFRTQTDNKQEIGCFLVVRVVLRAQFIIYAFLIR